MPPILLADAAAPETIGSFDWAVIVFYMLGIVILGCLAGLVRRKGSEGHGYFLAGKSLTWPVIGLALFATNISTIHLVSLAQAGYDTGLAMGNFEWIAAAALICLSFFFAPFYIRSKVTTLPDFLEKRYCRGCRDWFAVISICSAVFIHMGFTLYTGAAVLEGFTGFDRMWCIVVVAGLTGLYTIVGGLLAVVLTESIQTIVLLLGATVITVIGYYKIGGWDAIQSALPQDCANHLHIVRGPGDASDLPWYSVLLGCPVLALWYWCTDQTIVQRVLGAKDENHARVGPLFAGFIKILPVFILVLPGTICLALIARGQIAPLPVDETGKPDSLQVYAHMIKVLLPVGFRGIVAAALLAALMSTVSGALNSIGTLFSYDLYKRWKPDASDHTLVYVGRIATAVAMVVAILWSPLLEHYESIFKGIQQMMGCVCPPVTALFVFGVFWRRASATAALTTAWFGTLLGIIAFFIDWFDYLKGWELSYRFHIPFLMIPVYLFTACLVVLVLVSYSRKLALAVAWSGTVLGLLLVWLGVRGPGLLADWQPQLTNPCVLIPLSIFITSSAVLLVVGHLTPPQKTPPDAANLVWKTPLEALKGEAWSGIGNYRVLGVLLAVIMVLLYWTFA